MMRQRLTTKKMTDAVVCPSDAEWMDQALSLAARGLYSTSPNPRVGCVLVRNNERVGAGWHHWAGQDHAEVIALREAGQNAQGATAYVTLEPCHHHGNTPPCVEALIEAQVARVVVAMIDPDARTAGQSIDKLKSAGVDVSVGVGAEAARELNIGFVQRHQQNRPWVRVKVAVSLDGRSSAPDGQSQWITSKAARLDGHLWRARACAVLTGIGTVLADDPKLNARAETEWPLRQPVRVILDSHGRMPKRAKILNIDTPLWVISTQPAPAWAQDFVQMNWCVLPADSADRVCLQALMTWLAEQAFNEVHVEAGPRLTGAMMQAGWMDELVMYQAPVLLGDGQPMALMSEIHSLNDGLGLVWHDTQDVGGDRRLRLRRCDV